MLCILWDQVGVIYYELLKRNETITRERYQTQLMRLSRALPNPLRPTWKRSNGKSYPTRRIPQILRRPMAHGLTAQQFRSYEDIEK